MKSGAVLNEMSACNVCVCVCVLAADWIVVVVCVCCEGGG